jgi:signal peptidase I
METLRERLRGPWRLAIQQASMEPTLSEGDWLLVDPTTVRWPRRGSIVAFRQPDNGTLAVKRVGGLPGDRVPFREGYLELADDEAWLTADADEETTAAAGYGAAIDSSRFGPVPVELLVGRVWFRYAPLRRIGPIRRRPVPLPRPTPGSPPSSSAPG